MRDSYGITIQGPAKSLHAPEKGLRTQIFFYLGNGQHVGISTILPEGTKLEIQAVPQEGFLFWQDREGNPRGGHTLEVEAGAGETLTPYFQENK